MRKLEICEIKNLDVDLKLLPEVESEKGLMTVEDEIGMKVNQEVMFAIFQGIQKLSGEPEKFRVKPKLHIDLDHKLAWPIGWPVFTETEKVSDLFIPVGLSIGLLSRDNKVIAIQRSLKNKSCKGFLGTPAGFMTIAYQNFPTRKLPKTIDLKEEIKENVEDQLWHELGLNPDEYNWHIANLFRVDYPSNQQEFVVLAKSGLLAEEIVARADQNHGTSTGLAENRVIPMTGCCLIELISQGVPAATQHIAALFCAANLDYNPIINMDRPDPSVPYEEVIEIIKH